MKASTGIKLTVVSLVATIVAFWLSHRPVPPPNATGPASSVGWSPTSVQAKLPTAELWVGSKRLIAEIAREPVQLATGMMFRTNLEQNEAMLFVLPAPQQARFYMKNTLVPLSCAYLDGEGVILELHDMTPSDETPILSQTDNIQFVLEANRGWFKANQVARGTLVKTERGALSRLLSSSN